MHCFTGSKEFSEKLLTLNSYFSASGIITFKNSIELQKTFSFIPIDRLLIETDSPFLAPEPNRGKKNEPSFVKFTAEKLAYLKKISFDNVMVKRLNAPHIAISDIMVVNPRNNTPVLSFKNRKPFS